MYEDLEQVVKENGFESLKEFNNMVAKVDISTSVKLMNFKIWQNSDGSKEGLQRLMDLNGSIDRE